jgi:hypothetical protein
MLVKTPFLAGIIKDNFHKAVNRFTVPLGGKYMGSIYRQGSLILNHE